MSIWLKRALSLNQLRKTLGFGNIFAAIKFDLSVDASAKVNFKKALVLSPHPDDDCFGLGGTIKKMTTAGAEVTVVYFTDGAGGAGGVAGAPEESGQKYDKNLIEKRKIEAGNAAKILGIKETIFWGYKDGKLAAGHSAAQALKDLIEKIQPEIIFLPSFLDNHPDHRATNEIFINAVNALEKPEFEIWAYEVWSPIFINRLVDITLYIKTKEEAVAAYQSQISSRRYDKAAVGLAQYRAEVNNIRGFAEGFFAAPFNLYKELYEKS